MSAIAAELQCAECGATMVLKQSRYGPFFGCTQYPLCDGTHGAHPDGRPLGIPANKATKRARIEAHEAFDSLWQRGGMKRKAAYLWLREAMGLLADEAHIGLFDIAQCEQLKALIAAHKAGR